MVFSVLVIFLSIHFVGDIALNLISTSSDTALAFKALAYVALFVLVAHISMLMLVLLLIMHIAVDTVTSTRFVERYPEKYRAAPYSLGLNQVLKVLVIIVLLLVVH